jgi:hypothetical protein
VSARIPLSSCLKSLQLATLAVGATAFFACSQADPGPVSGSGSGGSQAGGAGGGTAGSGGANTGGNAAAGGSGGTSPSDSGTGGASEGGSCAAGDLLCDPQTPFPKQLKDTKFFPSAPDLTKHHERLRPYTPSPELWSDGLHKQRYLLLPEGTKIDNTMANNWVFPVGTLMVKNFLDDGPSGNRPVETRFVRKKADTFYEFAVYKWNAAGTDADLVDNIGDTRTPVSVTLGGQTFNHDLPSQQDCKACHSANAKKNDGNGQSIIGFDEIRLNSKLDASSTGIQLPDFADVFMMPPPATPASITDPDATQQQVKRFVYGNCVHCHNNNNSPIDFSPDVFVANTVCKPADDGHIMAPAGWFRINPKKPDMSVAYVQAMGVKPGTVLPDTLRPMPPVGVTIPSPELDNMKKWINALPLCK